ncbi:hypothetical protein QTP88_007720 [Uroleucon formosanum]
MLSDDEDILTAVNLINVLNHNQGSIVRKYWVHPFWHANCNNCGVYSVFKELNDRDRFKTFYRMEKSTFEELVRLVKMINLTKNPTFLLVIYIISIFLAFNAVNSCIILSI